MSEFVNTNPCISVLIIFLAYHLLRLPFICVTRLLRHLNVRKAGWPPPHLDADGDWKERP